MFFCRHNKIEGLPTELSSLRNLHSLHLEHNKIAEIPEWLPQIRELQDLVNITMNITKENIFLTTFY